MNLGYVGLGVMGGALARKLMETNKIRAYDVRPQVVEAFGREGAVPAQSAAALAGECDMVLTCLPTSNEVRQAIFGEGGIAEGLKEGGIVADMTTGDPIATRAMAAELAERGITLIDAPVSGGPHGAAAGTIAIMVGAPAGVFERVAPVFRAISPNVMHTGDVGTGHTMKLVNNVIACGLRLVTFEAVTMGIKNGLSLETCIEVLQKGSARSYTTDVMLPRLADGSIDANFQLGLMLKDVRLATQLGIDSGSPMFLGNIVRELVQMVAAEHGADKDVNMSIRTLERLSGTEVVPRSRP